MAQPKLSHLPLPSSLRDHFVHIISNLLTPEECSTQIKSHTTLVKSNVTTHTIREREIFHDEALASLLWSRLELFYGKDEVVDEDGCIWMAKCFNDRFRLCKYVPGGKFAPHTDGRRLASLNTQSFMTINMYLNTVSTSQQGSTRVLQQPAPNTEPTTFTPIASIQPVLGTAAVFRDSLWHDSAELLEGEKYLLRTDVMYERAVLFDFDALYGGLGDRERGMKALEIAARLEDAGSEGEAVGWYKKAFRLCPGLDR